METHYEGIPECYFRVSAKAIVKNKEGKILFVREETGVWDIPGGGVDHGENVLEALHREIKEEIGVNISFVNPQPYHVSITESSGIGGPKKPICLVFYECQLESLDFTPNPECEEINFMGPQEAIDSGKLYYPNIKVMGEFLEK